MDERKRDHMDGHDVFSDLTVSRRWGYDPPGFPDRSEFMAGTRRPLLPSEARETSQEPLPYSLVPAGAACADPLQPHPLPLHDLEGIVEDRFE